MAAGTMNLGGVAGVEMACVYIVQLVHCFQYEIEHQIQYLGLCIPYQNYNNGLQGIIYSTKGQKSCYNQWRYHPSSIFLPTTAPIPFSPLLSIAGTGMRCFRGPQKGRMPLLPPLMIFYLWAWSVRYRYSHVFAWQCSVIIIK